LSHDGHTHSGAGAVHRALALPKPAFCVKHLFVMEKTLDIKLTDGEASRIKAVIAKCDEALVRVFKQMKKDQAEIEKLKTETREILAELKAA
jgi:hypothetical protein